MAQSKSLRSVVLSVALICTFFAAFPSTSADEGQWPLSMVHKLDLKKAGIEVDASEIFNDKKPSLVDAICRPDGRHRAPVVVVVLAVPGGDTRIRQCGVDHREVARHLESTLEVLLDRNLHCDLVEEPWRCAEQRCAVIPPEISCEAGLRR